MLVENARVALARAALTLGRFEADDSNAPSPVAMHDKTRRCNKVHLIALQWQCHESTRPFVPWRDYKANFVFASRVLQLLIDPEDFGTIQEVLYYTHVFQISNIKLSRRYARASYT